MGASVRRNIFLIHLFMCFFFFVFFFPILQIFMRDLSFSLTEIALVGIVTNVVRLLLEVPSGAWSDRWGRVKTVRLIPVVMLPALVFFVESTSLVGFLIAGALFGATLAILSGSIHSLLYDSLAGKKTQFKKVLGNVYLYASIAGAVSAAVSGFMFTYDSQLPFYASMISIVIVFIISLFMKEPQNKPKKTKNYLSHFKQSFHEVFRTRQIRFITLYVSLISFVFVYLFYFGQIYLEESAIPIIIIGIIYGIRLLVEGVGNIIASRFVNTSQHAFLSISAFSMLGILVWSFYPQIWIVFILIFGLFGALRVLQTDFIHTHVSQENRATVESIISFTIGITLILFTTPVSYVGDLFGLFWSMIMLVFITGVTTLYVAFAKL